MMYPEVRLRRLRQSQRMRDLVCETRVSKDELMLPMFFDANIGETKYTDSMPGVPTHPLSGYDAIASGIQDSGVGSVLVFGVPSHKDPTGTGAYEEHGVVQKAIEGLKENSDLLVAADLCLCEYTDHGHCGVLTEDGEVLNDETLDLYARMLWMCERTVYTNVAQQKTPRIVKCSEKQRLSLMNLFAQVDGFMPVVWADKDLDLSGVEVLDTASPYVADKVQIVKHQIWNEALTYLGIENTNTDKKERLITGEVMSNMGDVEAQRFTRLNSRKQFCKEVNEMFGLDIDCDFRSGMYIRTDKEGLVPTEGMNRSSVDESGNTGHGEGSLWSRIKKALKGA